jgi:hypothetical protein
MNMSNENQAVETTEETINFFGSAFLRHATPKLPAPIEVVKPLPVAPAGKVETRAVKPVPVLYRKTKVWVVTKVMPDDTMLFATEGDEWTQHLEHAKIAKVGEQVMRGERMSESLTEDGGQIEIRPVLIGEGMKVALAPLAAAA